MKTAVIYARYSCERQTEQSIEGQLRVCGEFAKNNDLTILDTYIDRATTGTNDNRAAFQRMLADSEKAKWDIVLVYAIDRFGRNSIEIAINKQRLQKNGTILISATQRTATNIDGSRNLDGILLENVLIGLSEYYSAELSQKITRGMKESRSKGQYTGGTLPYGYYVKDKKVYIDEDKAKVIRYIFNETLHGVSAPNISEDLAKRGVYHMDGQPFKKKAIYNILRLERYIGIWRFKNGEVYDNIFPQIIDKDVFNAVQELIKDNVHGSKATFETYLLCGKLFCGYCGERLTAASGTSCTGAVYKYYKCTGKNRKKNPCHKKNVKKGEVERLVVDVATRMFCDKNNIKVIADAVMDLYATQTDDLSFLSLLRTEEEKIRSAIGNVLAAIEQGIITPSTKDRLNALENKLTDLQTKIYIEEQNARKRLTREEIVEYLTHSIKKEPKLLIHLLVKKVIIYDDKLEIYFKFTDKKVPDNGDKKRPLNISSKSEKPLPPRPKPYCLVGFLLVF